MTSRRTREAWLLGIPTLLGLIGVASVATSAEDEYVMGPVGAVAAVVAVFAVVHVVLRRRLPNADPYILPLVASLTAIGLVELYRLTPSSAADQVLWVAVGGAVAIAIVMFLPDHHVLQNYAYLTGLAAVALLLATMIFGQEVKGAKLWIPIGAGQSIQPAEFAKILLVIFLAAYLRDRREVLAIPTTRLFGVPMPALRHLAPGLAFVGVALVAVVVLNDFGTAFLFLGVLLAMLYLATGRWAYPAIGFGLFGLGAVAVYLTVGRIQDRVTAWISPFDDTQGLGYQTVQSLYALGDGGTFGPGFGNGSLLRDDGTSIIPELRTDFIFSAIGNELGYIGGLAVLVLFLLLIHRGFVVAAQANDGFSKLLAAGLTTVLALQTFVIVGGIVRLVPLTGVTLPFMSYGGSSIVTNFAAIALLLIISDRSHRAPSGSAA